MAEFEDDDIDKIFKEMFLSNEGEDDVKQDHIDAIMSIEKVSDDLLMKELIFISQSLSQAIAHVNELMLNIQSMENYVIDDEIKDILGSIYKLTEDLDDCMLEILLEESELREDEDE